MHEAPLLRFAGLEIDISSFLMIIITGVIVFTLARLSVRNLSVTDPSKLQNFMEWIAEFVRGIVASAMDFKRGKVLVSLALTLIMFIFVANVLGLPFSIVTEHHQEQKLFGQVIISESDLQLAEEKTGHRAIELLWYKSPTVDLSVTSALAVLVFLVAHGLGLIKNTRKYIKSYFQPFSIFLPLNIINELSKPLTLAVRLFANIFAGELLISVILMSGMFGIPLLVVWQGFSIFVGAIQAFLFTILTMVYIGQAAVPEEP